MNKKTAISLIPWVWCLIVMLATAGYDFAKTTYERLTRENRPTVQLQMSCGGEDFFMVAGRSSLLEGGYMSDGKGKFLSIIKILPEGSLSDDEIIKQVLEYPFYFDNDIWKSINNND